MARRRLNPPSDGSECHEDQCQSHSPPWQHPPMPPPRGPSPPVPSASHEPSHRLINLFLILAAIFAASILLTLIYCAILRNRRRRPVGSARAGALSDDDYDSVSLDEGPPFHHVWYIRSVGLDESTIASIAVAEYRAGDGLLDGVSDCSVCLGEFRDGERVRLLHKCGHAFHISCIDTWLRAHISCPLCRAHIVEADVEPAADAGALPIAAAAAESADSGSGSSDSAAINQVGNQPPEEAAEDNEEPESTIQAATPIDPYQLSSGFAESSLSQEVREPQPVRRSISMDAPLMNSIIFGLKPDEEDAIDEDGKDPSFDEENPCKMRGKQENPAKEAMDQKVQSDLGRSSSSSGRGFFFSRHGRVARVHSMTT